MDKPAEVSVTNSLSFMDLLLCRSMPHHPVYRAAESTLIFVLVIEIVMLIQTGKPVDFSLFPWVFFIAPLIPSFGSWMVYRRIKSTLKSTITLTPECIDAAVASGVHSKTDWKTVSLITKRHDAIVIQVSRSPDLYYWIPIRCFPSETQAQEFYAKTKEYWENLRFSTSLEARPHSLITDPSKAVDVRISFRELVISDYFLKRAVLVVGLIMLSLTIKDLVFIKVSMTAPFLDGFLALGCFLEPLRAAWYKVKRHPGWLSSRISISEDGLQSCAEQAGFDTFLPWISFKKIFVWHNTIFLQYARATAIGIPVHCFPTPESADTFCRSAQEYLQRARAKQIESTKKEKK